jgi:hypothetical protein
MTATPTVSPVNLLRRWVVDYFNRHDAKACTSFVTPDYALHIGDVVLAGRDENWLPAVDKQMQLFPDLGMTVHQVISGESWVASWFSEHGTSKGRAACWSGVAIYQSDGHCLTGCVAQEDYATRQRQLKSGVADAVEPPAAAPWETPVRPRNVGAENVVQRWLDGAWPKRERAVRCDDEHLTGAPLRFDLINTAIWTLVSSGDDVAFHAHQNGIYLGGLDVAGAEGRSAHLHSNGIVRVVDGRVSSGRIIRGRAGLRAALQKGTTS